MSEAAKNRRSFSMAYLLAQCAPPLKLPDKQPTAYSYNGVVLPKLPEWDKTVYPYAVIQWSRMIFSNGLNADREPYYADLIVSDQPLFVAQGEPNSDLVAKNPVLFMQCNSLDGEDSSQLGMDIWKNFTSDSENTTSDKAEIGVESYFVHFIYYDHMWGTTILDYRLQWANYDIRNLVTDEVCLAKSDPIPVYE